MSHCTTKMIKKLKKNKIMEFWKVWLLVVPLWAIVFKLQDILNELKKK